MLGGRIKHMSNKCNIFNVYICSAAEAPARSSERPEVTNV